MKKVILCPNPYRDRDFTATRRSRAMLQECGVEVVICLPFHVENLPVEDDIEFKNLQMEIRSADLLIAYGGDGTILHLAKICATNRVPILGVNMGSLGFISELEFSELDRLKELADWNFKIENRMMLDISVRRGDREIYSNIAMNEAVVTKGAISNVVHLRVLNDGVKLAEMRGDGVIVATPTGSTGYSLSAGGPVLEPTVRNLVICPICAHVGQMNCYVLSPRHEITVLPVKCGRKAVYLSVDGGRAFSLRDGDEVRITSSRVDTKLVRLSEKSFCEIFEKKMLGGVLGEK